jgi:hypothetical protein
MLIEQVGKDGEERDGGFWSCVRYSTGGRERYVVSFAGTSLFCRHTWLFPGFNALFLGYERPQNAFLGTT